jgi:hypothetical protein
MAVPALVVKKATEFQKFSSLMLCPTISTFSPGCLVPQAELDTANTLLFSQCSPASPVSLSVRYVTSRIVSFAPTVVDMHTPETFYNKHNDEKTHVGYIWALW